MIIQRCTARGLHVPQEVAVLCQHFLKAVVDVAPQISSIEPNYERVSTSCRSNGQESFNSVAIWPIRLVQGQKTVIVAVRFSHETARCEQRGKPAANRWRHFRTYQRLLDRCYLAVVINRVLNDLAGFKPTVEARTAI